MCIDHVWSMSMYKFVSGVVGKQYLLWPSCSLDKTPLAFTLPHFVLRGQICLLFLISLDLLLLLSNPLWFKGYLFWFFFLECLVGLHRTDQLPLLQHQWLGHRLGLLWYWMVCLGNKWRSFCCFWCYIKFTKISHDSHDRVRIHLHKGEFMNNLHKFQC